MALSTIRTTADNNARHVSQGQKPKSIFTGLNIKYLRLIFFMGIGAPVVVGFFLDYLGFSPLIDVVVFDGLLQATATLMGFSSIAVFYYLTKIDDVERDFLNNFSDAFQTLANVRRYFLSRLSPESDITEDEIKAGFKNLKTKLEKEKEKIMPYANQMKNVVVNWGTLTLTSFGAALAFSVLGLLTTSFTELKEFSFTYLLTTVCSTTASTIMFVQLWKAVQHITSEMSGIIGELNQITGSEHFLQLDDKIGYSKTA